jgi:2-keto-4-pentenoate hydratase
MNRLAGELESELASTLWDAARTVTAVGPLSAACPTLDAQLAYRVQDQLVALRLAAGERIIGAKLGFTSAAMREQMGVSSSNRGWLTDAMLLGGEEICLSDFIHPRVEPEIAFILGASLRGPGVTPVAVLAATSAVAPCLEVVDSRFKDYVFTAADNTADNSSAAALRVGDGVDHAGIELDRIGVVLERNGSLVQAGTSAAALGHPAAAVAWLANELHSSPRALEPGDIVISGGLTAAPPLTAGDRVVARFDQLGSIGIVAEG